MKRGKKQNRKILKSIKKLDVGDSVNIGDYEIICIDDLSYLAIHQQKGIFDKSFKELEEWIVYGRELD